MVTQLFTGKTRTGACAVCLDSVPPGQTSSEALSMLILHRKDAGCSSAMLLSFLIRNNTDFQSQSLGSWLLHFFMVANSLIDGPLQRLRLALPTFSLFSRGSSVLHCPLAHCRFFRLNSKQKCICCIKHLERMSLEAFIQKENMD